MKLQGSRHVSVLLLMVFDEVKYGLDFAVHIALERNVKVEPKIVLAVEHALEELSAQSVPGVEKFEQHFEQVIGC